MIIENHNNGNNNINDNLNHSERTYFRQGNKVNDEIKIFTLEELD